MLLKLQRRVMGGGVGSGPPRRHGVLGAALVVLGLLVPLLGVPRALPRQATPAACVPGGQVSTSDDSFGVVPGASANSDGNLYEFDSTSGAAVGSPTAVGSQPIAMSIPPITRCTC